MTTVCDSYFNIYFVSTGIFEVQFWNQEYQEFNCNPYPCDWHTTLLHYATVLRMRSQNDVHYKSPGNLTYDVVNFTKEGSTGNYGQDKVIGDFTAKYTYIFKTQTIQKIQHFTPDVKLLYMFRDPTDRAISHLNYVFKFRPRYVQDFLLKWNTSTDGIAKQIHRLYVEAIEKYENCLTVYCENFCATNTPDGPDFYASSVENLIAKTLLNGLYDVFIKKQLEVTPTEQILIIDLGDFSDRPLSFMESTVLPFIGLEPYDPVIKDKLSKATPLNVNKSPLVTCLPETISLLRKFYSKSLRQLSIILNGRKFSWYSIYGL